MVTQGSAGKIQHRRLKMHGASTGGLEKSGIGGRGAATAKGSAISFASVGTEQEFKNRPAKIAAENRLD